MLSPALAAMRHDAFTTDTTVDSTVSLAEHRGESDLNNLDLNATNQTAADRPRPSPAPVPSGAGDTRRPGTPFTRMREGGRRAR